eukprot:CAMPEP_0195285954 /NCGR_PEP_ID=MMETSP0707-20130614/3598_1 /TAXON_ID=33640 /ORGANISM="Asterionellopsis glacialis, Strain CCMP134" /LENGTH=398 /DNA_ID=CAMNT_0040345531 /DNA_START=106 /DNA_END=1302 /DNA_ORIENTATION=+
MSSRTLSNSSTPSRTDIGKGKSATNLPNELLSLIFSYLPSPQDLCAVERTCRDWSDAMHSDECGAFCWRNLIVLKIIYGFGKDACKEEQNHEQRWIDTCQSNLGIPNAFGVDIPPNTTPMNDGVPLPLASITKQMFRNARRRPYTCLYPSDDVHQKDNMCSLYLHPWRHFDDNRAVIGRGGYVCSSSPPVTMIRTCHRGGCLAVVSARAPCYFEVSVGPRNGKVASRIHAEECLSVGLCSWGFPLRGFQPGWPYHNTVTSVGYHGDDGKCFVNSTTGEDFGPKFGTKEGDVVGCGLDCVNRSVFFTFNGKFVGYGAYDIEEGTVLYPAIGIGTYSEIYWNFGAEPFVYDLFKYDYARGAKTSNGDSRSMRRPLQYEGYEYELQPSQQMLAVGRERRVR